MLFVESELDCTGWESSTQNMFLIRYWKMTGIGNDGCRVL